MVNPPIDAAALLKAKHVFQSCRQAWPSFNFPIHETAPSSSSCSDEASQPLGDLHDGPRRVPVGNRNVEEAALSHAGPSAYNCGEPSEAMVAAAVGCW
ncbi:hypothetical protein N9L68_05095 [bacterium]|nr:hypothetical protein [bacterium]